MMRALSRACGFAAGIAAAVAMSSATALAVSPRPYVDPNPKFFDAHPVWGTILAIYIAVAGLIVFPMVRRPFMRWYRSQRWFVRGSDPIEIMFKQMGMRFSVEAFAFMVSCLVGALGGWLYVLLRTQGGGTAEVRTAD